MPHYVINLDDPSERVVEDIYQTHLDNESCGGVHDYRDAIRFTLGWLIDEGLWTPPEAPDAS